MLSDPQLRAVYDKEGEAGLSGDKTEAAAGQVDPSLVFTFLFGSDAFEDIVGRLQLVTQVMIGEEHIEQSKMKELERRRIMRLALKLRDRIAKYVTEIPTKPSSIGRIKERSSSKQDMAKRFSIQLEVLTGWWRRK